MRARHSIFLNDAYKGYTFDLDKAIPPEETIVRFRERLKAIDLDILDETVRIDHGRLDIPVYFSVCGRDAEKVIGSKKQMGKGGTPEQAEASAVMELAERFSLFSFLAGPDNFVVEEYRNIKDRAIPFESIARSVHDDSRDLEGVRQIFSRLPLKWTWAYNITKGKEILVPFNWFFAINEYNGSSAGNCKEEAILQGVCEVVERHVSSLISRNRLNMPGIDLDSISDQACLAPSRNGIHTTGRTNDVSSDGKVDPLVIELLKKYRGAGIRVYTSDFTMDTGIPTVGVLAYDPSTFPEKSEIVWTAGTTPSPQKALIRALTEVAQLAGDFDTSSNYVPSGLPKFKSLPEADFVIYPENKVSVSSLPDLSDKNIKVEIESCIAALSRIGLEVYLVDITNPKLDIPAFYTIVPGAHFRERAQGSCMGMFCAKMISEMGNPEWAVERLKDMDETLPDKYYVKFFLGLSHLSLNDHLIALKYFRNALKLEPESQDIPSIYSYMGLCFKELERYTEAIRVLEKAEAQDHERTDVHNLMGYCYFKLKKYEEAIKCFREVLRLDPGSAIDYMNIASSYRDMGNREMAVHYYRFALELDPTMNTAWESLHRLEQATEKG
jgi:ribosomal protein S12 methylthiotransferase accessory factor